MTTRRTFLAAAGTTAAAGLTGCTELGGGDGDDGGDGGDGDGGSGNQGTPNGPVATAPVPDDPGATTYARMDAGASTTITYLGNWKCPFCAEFSTGSDRVLSLGTIVSDYVAPGDLALEYRALSYTGDGEPFLGPDAPRAARAGLAVWNVDPDNYWRYHEHVMANQPAESKRWATKSKLVEFAREAGVSDPEAVGTAIGGGEYESEVRANTEFAANSGVEGTPAVVVGDASYSPFEPDSLRSALEGATE
ncbi:DsbA family protein [Haloglomus halophilum]|uniref:DsbA family protein n=1 Tax=Haloglomus halophilum TaxID=2962672 RepID=UPI0020C97E6D|nr:DsbA family protein [Haloglomus halophilum]